MELNGRTALVTGGAVRIGQAVVETLSRAGARVVIHYHESEAEAGRLCAGLREQGAAAWILRADLADDGACAGLIDAAAKQAGAPMDILVNNAAVFHKDTFETLTPGALRDEFQRNLFAPILLMQAFARQDRPGRIVNLLDRRVTGLDPSAVPYVLAKKGLAEATRLAALAFAPRIAVNAVGPGPVLPPPGTGAEHLADRAGFIPLGRTCSPDEIAEAVVFLLKADGITGQCLFVDGGQHLLTDPQRCALGVS
jgi:NAD(P)-dependent dehydrogenase (short-subunit alcohol dehydrogenase family)